MLVQYLELSGPWNGTENTMDPHHDYGSPSLNGANSTNPNGSNAVIIMILNGTMSHISIMNLD